MSLVVKNLPSNADDIRDVSLILGQEDALEEGVSTHSRILAWKIPWTEEPGGLQSMGLKGTGHDWPTKPARLWYSGYLEGKLLWG